MTHNHDQDKSNSVLPKIKDISFGEEIDIALAITAAALTADQLWKVVQSKKHKVSHLAKAGISAGLAAAAVDMYQRDAKDEEEEHHKHHRSHSVDRISYDHQPHYYYNDYYYDTSRRLTNGRETPSWDDRQYEYSHRPMSRRRSFA